MFQVGFAKQDLGSALRPEKPLQEERIEAIGLYLTFNDLRGIWITLDFMDFDLHVVRTLAEAVRQSTGIDPMHIHIVTTHNHGGGEPDLTILSELTAQCAQNAIKNAAPARMRWAHCKTDRQVNIIRRYPVPELAGVNTVFYGVTEETGFDCAPFAEYAINAVKCGRLSYSGQTQTQRPVSSLPAGDRDIFALQFCDTSGQILGTVVRFAAHAVCCNQDDSYTSDYPYHVRKGVEQVFGGVGLFWNGPCGDIAPCMTSKTDGTQIKLGRYLAELASNALKNAAFSAVTILKDTSVSISLPVRKEVQAGTVTLPKQVPDELPKRREYLENQLFSELMEFLKGKYRNGESSPGDTICVSLGLLQLNDLLLAAFPGETFSVTGSAIMEAFPDRSICTVTEHGRTVMYLPPEDDCNRGGYESVCRTTATGAEGILRSEAIQELAAFVV